MRMFSVFALTLFLYVLNNLMMSILNGQQDIKRYNVANVISSIIGLILTGSFVYYFGLEERYAMVINQSVVLVSTLILLVKSNSINFIWGFTGGLNRGYVKKFATYTSMALAVSAVVVPTSQIILRDFAGQSLSWQEKLLGRIN